MAANMFMHFDDIEGDATEANHEKWVVLESASWEVERAVDMSDLGSTQRGHANSNFGKLECETQVGIISNELMLSVANGTVRPEIIMHWCRSGESAGDGLKEYCIWTLKDSVVDSYSVSADSEGIPTATFTLAYRSLEVEYKETNPKTGKLSTKNTFKWNLQTGKVE